MLSAQTESTRFILRTITMAEDAAVKHLDQEHAEIVLREAEQHAHELRLKLDNEQRIEFAEESE